MDTFYTKLVAFLLVLLQIGSVISTPIVEASDANELSNEERHILTKRGGARAFYGFYNSPNSKRDSVAEGSPYYLYDKRGGGRAFNHNSDLFYSGFDKRGGGRAFGGSWSPYLERFYDYKRSGYPIYYSDNAYF